MKLVEDQKVSKSMARLLIHVEGETEESFINDILRSHLYKFGYSSVTARLIGNARQRDRRGGIRAWKTVRKDIINHLKEDSECLSTTMVDFYALPQTGDGAWPGRAEAGKLEFSKKATSIESALLEDVCNELGREFNYKRFIPFIMMHEFEGLLFSDTDKFGLSIGRTDLSLKFKAIRNQFKTPEEINDSPITAPSKRIKGLIPNYEKPILGILAILEIGLDTIRKECPHFKQWLEQLEQWPRN